MIGHISASNQLRTSSELAPNMFGASSELASVMEFGFKIVERDLSLSEVLLLRFIAVIVSKPKRFWSWQNAGYAPAFQK